MNCIKCNKHIPEESNYCRFCGTKVNINKDNLDQIIKRYKDTGNTSIALSIFALINNIVLSLDEYALEEIIIGSIIIFPFLLPFYYFGQKLKMEGTNNFTYSLKLSKNMFIYTIVVIVLNFLLGEVAGWLWFILAYYFYKSYTETKSLLENSE